MQNAAQHPHEFSYMTQRNGMQQFTQPVQQIQQIQPVQTVQAIQPVQPVQPVLQSNPALHPSYVPYAAYVNHPESSNINTIVNEKINTEMKKLEHENKLDEIARKFQNFENKYSKLGTVEAFTSETSTNMFLVIGGVAIFGLFIMLIIILCRLNSISTMIQDLYKVPRK
jgi:hypothetical protein